MSDLKATYLTGYNLDAKANPGVRHEAGLRAVADAAVAAMTPKAPQPEPERTFEELMQDDRIRYTARRDDEGNIRLSRGHGALVAIPTDTRADVQAWFEQAGGPKWAATYKAALILMDEEAAL